MKNISLMITFFMLLMSTAWGADFNDAMQGWTTSDGTFHPGVLIMEGCSKKNPLGKQKLKADLGNYRNGKICRFDACTVAGVCYRDHWADFDFANPTLDKVLTYYQGHEWKTIRGSDLKSTYLAYKLMRMAVLMGQETAVRLLEETVNDLNGKDKDFPVNGVMTNSIVDYINDFTAPETLADGSKSNWKRWCFFAQLKLNAEARCGKLIAKNPKLKVFWDNWDEENRKDRS